MDLSPDLARVNEGEITRVKFGPWTTREIAELRKVADMGAEAAAEILGRTPASVRRRAQKSRISLRRHDSKAGRILGIPNGVRLAELRLRHQSLATIRDDALAGVVDLERMAERLTPAARRRPLCPSCGRRPQDTGSGLCLVCHLSALADAHADELAISDARRRLDRERQRKHRLRVVQ